MPTLFVVFDKDAGFEPDELLGGRALSEHADTLSKISTKIGAADLFDSAKPPEGPIARARSGAPSLVSSS